MANSTFKSKITRIERDLQKITYSYNELVERILELKMVPSSPENLRKFRDMHQQLAELQVHFEYVGDGVTLEDKIRKEKLSNKIDDCLKDVDKHISIYDRYL